MREQLLANPIFAAASPDAFARLLEHAELRSYERGATVLADGDPAAELFALVEGAVRVFHAAPNGDEVVLKLFRPPAIFGESESLCGVPFIENVCALEPSRAVVFPIAAIVRFLEESPRASVLMLVDVTRRLVVSAYNEKSLAFHPVTVRLANHLLDHIEWASTAPDATPFISLNQDQMATAIGATRRSVAKDMIGWQDEGILAKEGAGYRVRDLAALSRYADPQRLALTHRIAESRADGFFGTSFVTGATKK